MASRLLDPDLHNTAESKSNITNEAALPKLYGQPLLQLPNDLYIPPHALEIFLDAFEGPLDLLLYLIRKQNFNILDIPVSQVTLQYLQYIEQIRLHNLELAADYLLMAAMLIDIKARMLLPIHKNESSEENIDPRAELVKRLLEYEQIKQAALKINEIPQLGRDFFRTTITIEKSPAKTWPQVPLTELQAAWQDIVRREKLMQRHQISREELSVREHMSVILRRLQTHHFVEFSDLLNPKCGVPVIVMHFIALLELAKENLIEITQAAAFSPIYVRLSYYPT